ncbi:MAG: C1 family peptidase [Bacilli bacterium]
MIQKNDINNFRTKYENNKTNKIRHRMLNKVKLVDLIQDNDTNLNQSFSINIKTHNVTDQEHSGRCWSFAGLNILREKVIEKCGLENFELSGSYIAFYDKLERFNILLERLISYKKEGKDLYDRYVSSLLKDGMFDGGFFTGFSNLVNKYGVVPKDNFPESFSSSNTYEINQILSRLLRKFYLDLENCTCDEEQLKNKYLENVYFVIADFYGVPPEKFNFEYTDKDGNYHIDKELTPKEFYDKYIGIDLKHDYVEIISYQDKEFKYNNIYEIEETSIISGKEDNLFLNIPSKGFRNLIIKQLKNEEPVYFYCSTTSKRIEGVWTDLLKRYGDVFDIDLYLDRNSILKTNGITDCHCMLITGVNVVDDKTDRWKIENSWGNKYGNKGYYVATDDWIDTYVHRIVINKRFLEKKHLEILKQNKIKMEKWKAKC